MEKHLADGVKSVPHPGTELSDLGLPGRLLFEQGGAEVFERQEEEDPARTSFDDGEPIRCRFCESEVANEAAVFGVGDRPPVSTFFNPQGQLMEVLTVRVAPGLRAVGSPSTQFSWFPGTAWQIGACRGCGLQLGWAWSTLGAAKPARFSGLLTDRIRRG